MKILIDIRLLSKGVSSGISGYTKELLDKIFELDKENEYWLFYNGFRRYSLPIDWLNLENVNILERSIPNKLLDLSLRFFNRPRIDKRIKPDLIFSPHFNILASTETPRIITIHDLSFMHFAKFFSVKQRLWHWLQNYRSQIQLAQKIIVVSEFCKRDVIDLLQIPEEKISVVYSGIKSGGGFGFNSGVNSGFYRLDQKDLRRLSIQRKFGLNEKFILYLGALESRKNIIALIRAFSILKAKADFADYQLVLAGRAGYGAKKIIKEANQCGFINDIKFLSNVADDERVILYNLANVFVYPSVFEGFGFPPLEAQACGTPVIVSNRTSLAEIIGSSGLYFNPWRPDELAEQIKKIETNAKVRQNKINA
jgi:glycosyltransferase involved in cell wall biosynthesis